ncbi:MAG: glycoside hydrolase family 9 protein [Pseudanabaenales cyanobacterium]|nr:glycoside hydrolase family 9 protein [Pseudanabaenales cyanobacterium]
MKNSALQTITAQSAQSPQSGKFNYAEALQKSFLFYEAQRSGALPDDNRIPWRGDSALTDGADVGRDLTGGYYDAGDHVKFGLPMAASMTMLAWGVEEYRSAYQTIGQLDEALDAIKWGTDYILKAYDSKNDNNPGNDAFYGQVGNGQADHAFWGSPEVMSMDRPTYQIDAQNPGSDLAGESAAALAAASIVFRSTDKAYADKLLDQAQKLFDFAETYRGKYSDSIQDAAAFYNSWSGYTDELAWGAAWLHKAAQAAGQPNQDYLSKAEKYFQATGGVANAPWTQNWDDKKYGAAILLAQETGDPNYQNQVESWLDRWLIDRQSGGIPEITDGGLAWLDQWGSLRYSANTAMLAGIYADTVHDKGGQYSAFAQQQMNYILGDNPNNRSYVVGFGQNSPINPHHRGAHGSTTNNIHSPADNQNILYGALVGGPNQPNDNAWVDKRDDFIANEVALDYNAGFTGALAYMTDKFGGAPLPDSQIPTLFDPTGSPPSPSPSPQPAPSPTPPPSPTPIPTPGDAGVDFSVVNDWGSGFQGQIAITNQGNSQMNGWTLEFEFPNKITQIWNAEIVSREGDRYVIRDVGWNSEVAPNGEISFGFIGEGSVSTEPSSFELNGQWVGSPAPAPTPNPVPTPTSDPIPTPVPNTLLELNKTYTGRGTYYGATGAGNAGYDVVPLDKRDMITALNRVQWNNSEGSGAFFQVSGPYQRDGKADPITVMVVDQLPDRGDGLDLSAEAFAKVADPIDGIVDLHYELVSPADDFITPYGHQIGDGIIVDRLTESNPWWPAVRLTNHRHPVQGLDLITNGGEIVPLERKSHNIFVLEQGIGGPINGKQDFVATDIFGQQVRLNDIDITSGVGADIISGKQFAIMA